MKSDTSCCVTSCKGAGSTCGFLSSGGSHQAAAPAGLPARLLAAPRPVLRLPCPAHPNSTHLLLVALNLHRQAAHIDGLHVIRQATLGLQHQRVLVALKAPACHLVLGHLERQVVGDKDESATGGGPQSGAGVSCRRGGRGGGCGAPGGLPETHRLVLRPSMSSIDVREPLSSAAALWDRGPPPCSSPVEDWPPKSPWARA